MRRILCLLVLLSGCDLYWGGGGGDDICQYGYGAADDVATVPAQLLRDPETGACQGYGGGGCNAQCGPCPLGGALVINPDWGVCHGACASLDETQCKATPGCLADYLDRKGEGVPPPAHPVFQGCWDTAPSGPVEGGGCAALDAQACTRHDDCSIVHTTSMVVTTTSFEKCIPETVAGCDATTCTTGSHCEMQCTQLVGNDGCQPMCVPDAPTCATVDCANGYTCVETCDPMTAGGGGSGVTQGCHASCVPQLACAALATEAACSNRSDCTPVYQGTDCTCTPGSCHCNVLTYERCE